MNRTTFYRIAGLAVALAAVIAAWELSPGPLALRHYESKWHFAFFGMGVATFALIPPLISFFRSNRARTKAEQELKATLDNLELKVHERTAAYEALNAQLIKEMANHATSAALLRDVTENVRELFWVSSAGGDKMLYVSPAYAEIWGRPVESLYREPMSFLQSIHPDDRDGGVAAARSEKVDQTYRILRPNGTMRWIRDRSYPIFNASGAISRVVGIAEDISDTKALQESLAHAQRLEAVGTLAGGIAHDFNNLLATISVSSDTLQLLVGDNDKCQQSFGDISYSCKQGTALVKSLLRFARKEQTVEQLVPMDALILETVSVARSTFDRQVAIEDDVQPDLWPVLSDPGRIHQVLMNLFINARDAILEQGGGTLKVIARNCTLDDKSPDLPQDGAPGRYVKVSVADDGVGISPAAQKHVFDPFFSTKAPGQGVGLGLSTAHGIVTSHGGAIKFESNVGCGTVLHFYLPAANESVPDAEVSYPPGRGVSAPVSGSVLIVDDEERLCHSLATHLRQKGYQVDVAYNGREVLDKVAQFIGGLDVVVLDLMMPEVSGWDVLRTLRQHHPSLAVIIMSGFAESERFQEIESLGFDGILEKPFRLQALDEELARVMTACRTGGG